MFAPREAVESWNLEDLQKWERLITYGRPGWASFFRAGAKENINPYTYEELIKLARSKLLGGHDISEWPPNEKPHMLKAFRIALLSRRALVRIGMRSEIARTMVASCMGVCLRVSEDLEAMLVDSLSEPILSEASARIINEYDLWPELLESLLEAMQYGAVETGRLGELAAWILLAIGWDAACKAKDASPYRTYTRSDISLGDLLKALVGKVPEPESESDPDRLTKSKRTRQDAKVQLYNAKKVIQDVMEMRLCYTHATRLQTSGVSLANLQMIACRMTLGVCAPGTDAVDAFLALLSPKGKPEELGALLLQIKNKGSFRPAEGKRCLKSLGDTARANLTQESNPTSPLPGLDLLLHVGDQSKTESKCEIFADGRSRRACVLLSTDSSLSLFKNVFAAVTGTPEAARRLACAFQRLIDAERSAFFKQPTWSMGSAPAFLNTPSTSGGPSLLTQMDKLTDVFFVEHRVDINQ